MKRILLSVPHMGGAERLHVEAAFTSNWISTVGPNLQLFEAAVSARIGLPCVALSSGTAAIHLGLRLLNVGPGDEVFCSTLTFAASANPIRYLGATPVFLDSEPSTWNLCPNLLRETLLARARRNRLPKAIEVVHLYGQCAQMDPIRATAREFEIPVLEDAAEALGATYRNTPAGALGDIGVFSFNGNKIITTSGGGMLLSQDPAHVEKARFLSMQAKDPGLAYHHTQTGYNYRMSNILAGVGLGQLEVLDDRVAQRRAIAFRYRDAFSRLPNLTFMPQSPDGLSTNWLSCFLVDSRRDDLIAALDRANIESRPVWKPMHLQPLFADCEAIGGAVAEDLFTRGICLPSSSSLTPEDQQRVIDAVTAHFTR